MKSLLVFILFFLFLSCSSEQNELWDYPVKPGTEEWKQFQSHEEMVRACQIPEKILLSLSTENLTDLCLRYPLLADVFAFENTNTGLDMLFNNFNGIRELYKRKDVSSSLLERYAQKLQSFSLLDEQNSDLEKGCFMISVYTIEILLSRIEWQESEGIKKVKKVLQSLVVGYETELKYPDYFNWVAFANNFFARAHLISKMCEQCLDMASLMQGSTTLVFNNEEVRDIINKFSYQLIY